EFLAVDHLPAALALEPQTAGHLLLLPAQTRTLLGLTLRLEIVLRDVGLAVRALIGDEIGLDLGACLLGRELAALRSRLLLAARFGISGTCAHEFRGHASISRRMSRRWRETASASPACRERRTKPIPR